MPRGAFAKWGINLSHNFLKAALLTQRCVQGVQLPALLFGIAGIGAEKLLGKERSFLTTGPRANFQNNISFIARISRPEQRFQCLLEFF